MGWLKFLRIQHSNRKDLIGQSAGGCGFWTLTPSCEGISFHMFSDDERETERKKEYLKKKSFLKMLAVGNSPRITSRHG